MATSSGGETILTECTGLLVKAGQPQAHIFRVVSHTRDPRRFALFVYEKTLLTNVTSLLSKVAGAVQAGGGGEEEVVVMPTLCIALTSQVEIIKGRAGMWSVRYRGLGHRKITEWHISGCSSSEFLEKLTLAHEITRAVGPANFAPHPPRSEFDWLWKFRPVLFEGAANPGDDTETVAFRSFQLLVVTWNVAGRAPPAADSSESAQIAEELGGMMARSPGVEIVGLCLQETCPLNASNALMLGNENGVLWTEWFARSMSGVWEVVGWESLVGLTLVVLRREESRLGIGKELRWSKVKTGFSGLVGNKGGVSVRVEIENRMTIAISNVHFSSGDGMESTRRKELAKLIEHTDFAHTEVGSPSGGSGSQGGTGGGLLENDFVVVGGDWNSRTTAEEGDELKKWIDEGFFLFSEGFFDFPPTYKLVIGEGGAGIGVYDQNRRPGWCDRVLHRGSEGVRVSVVRYDALGKVVYSDHTPVYWIAEIDILRQKDFFEKRRSLDI